MRFKGGGHFAQHSRPVAIVRIQDGDNVPRGHSRALVHGMVVAVVLLGHPHQAWKALEDLDCPISGTAIDHDMFNLWIILPRNTLQGRPDRMYAIEAGRDDRDLQWFRHGY